MDLKEMKVGDIVTKDFRTAQVFKTYGIDFCCGGNVSLKEITAKKNIYLEKIETELTNLVGRNSNLNLNYQDWEADFLADYIVNQYHNKVVRVTPQLTEYVNKIARVHGERHPELIEIDKRFEVVVKELLTHQTQEENILFPAIKEALSQGTQKSKYTIKAQLKDMLKDHDMIGKTMDEINALSNNYKLPNDACKTYMVAFKMLEEFEDDLHVHVHLENNILFPKIEKLAV